MILEETDLSSDYLPQQKIRITKFNKIRETLIRGAQCSTHGAMEWEEQTRAPLTLHINIH